MGDARMHLVEVVQRRAERHVRLGEAGIAAFLLRFEVGSEVVRRTVWVTCVGRAHASRAQQFARLGSQL
jgi:hypothetical protein